MTRRPVLVLVAVTMTAAALLGFAAHSGGAAAPMVGRAAPPLSGPTLGGGTVDLARLRGSVVLVNVWASWCAPCRDELPVLAGLQERFGGAGLEVVGIDFRDQRTSARQLLEKTGADSYRSLLDPDGRHAITWGVYGVPETFVVDPGGVVRARLAGAVTPEWLRTVLTPLLAAAPEHA